MSDLIKRIDALLSLRVESSATSTINNDCPLDPDVEKALRDCRAEIERLSKPYVPMTDDELQEIVAGWLGVSDEFHFGIANSTQAAVIKRAGLEVAK